MTLIFEVFNAADKQSIFISDCLISIDRPRLPEPNVFPLHLGSGFKIDTRGIGIVSKFWLADDRVILSAGKVDQIKSVVELFSSASNLEEFQNMYSIYYENKAETDAYLYKMRDGEIVLASHSNCVSFDCGHLTLFAGGSGRKYLRDVLEGNVPDSKVPTMALAAQLLAMFIRLEFTDYNFPTNLFGSAYEICVMDKNGPRRVPYTILESTGRVISAPDGVNELTDRKFTRYILCCPVHEGSIFIVISSIDGQSKVTHFFTRQINTSLERKPSKDEITQIILKHRAEITFSLVHHSDVNIATLFENLTDITQSDKDSVSIKTNTKRLNELEVQYYNSMDR
jgi:hypothetical protein